MPNIPSHFDLPRFAHKDIETWIDTFHKTMQRQWTMMTQAYNALLHVDTAANMPATPMLDETLWYEQDTGRSYVAVSGNWVHLSPWSGRTVNVSTNTYTLGSTDAVILADATSAAITITAPVTASRIRCVKKTDSSLNTVYVVPASGTIDGAVSKNISTAYGTLMFTGDGTNLYLVSAA